MQGHYSRGETSTLKTKTKKVSTLDCSHLSTLQVKPKKGKGIGLVCSSCGLMTELYPTLKDAVSAFWTTDLNNRYFAYLEIMDGKLRPGIPSTAEFIGYWQDRRAAFTARSEERVERRAA
jgi:hypothetical protein